MDPVPPRVERLPWPSAWTPEELRSRVSGKEVYGLGTALTKVEPRYHRPLTTFGCMHAKNALVVKPLHAQAAGAALARGPQLIQHVNIFINRKETANMATQTAIRPESNQTFEKKIQRVRELYATGPEIGKSALETLIRDMKSGTSRREPATRMSSAGRIGSTQGKVSELLVIAPLVPGGAERIRALLELRNGDFSDTDKVGTVHDMRFLFLDNETKMLFATAYDGDWDPYIDDFAAKIPDG